MSIPTATAKTTRTGLLGPARLAAAALLGLCAVTAAHADDHGNRFRGNPGNSGHFQRNNDDRLHDNRRYDNGRPSANRNDSRSERREEWRDDRRNYRNGYRDGYRQSNRDDRHWDRRGPVYYAPRTYVGHRWNRGDRLPRQYYEPRYVVDNYADYHLYAPYRGHHWVRVDNDALLVAFGTGVVAGLVIDAFN